MAHSISSFHNRLAVIAVFAFNRPQKIQACLESIEQNEEFIDSEVYIFQDGPKCLPISEEYKETTKIIEKFLRNKNVKFIKSEKNFGLQDSLINGINKIFESSNKIIVIEDDLLVSPYFLYYCNSYLNMYESEKSVASIHGYSYPIKKNFNKPYFLAGADCWGWATWKDRWDLFEPDGKVLLHRIRKGNKAYDFDLKGSVGYSNMLYRQSEGKLSSWAIRWHASMYLQNKVTLFPAVSLVLNTGADGSGTNIRNNNKYDTELSFEPSAIIYQKPQVSKYAEKNMIKYYRKINSYSILKIFTYKVLAVFNLYARIVFK